MKYALVTGAAGGMGEKTVDALIRAGYFVFALDKNAPREKEGCLSLSVDITDSAALAQAFARVSSQAGQIDALVHLAGVYMLDSLLEMEESAFRRLFEINLIGAYLVNKTFAPLLHRGACVLLVTSELAPLSPLPFTGAYAVSKAALDKYAYSLRMEWQLLGVSVSVLRAGAVNTGMLSVSTDALARFTQKTALYSPNARRFARIVDSVEARCVPPERLAKRVVGIVGKRRRRFVYNLNRNPLLLLLEILPRGLRFFIIRKILQ